VVLTEWRKNVARSSGGLTRWFKENWVDVKTGKPCGRSKGEKRGYPACRPKKRVSSKTPKTVGEMTASEKARFKREKTSSKKITYQHKGKRNPALWDNRCEQYMRNNKKGTVKKSTTS